MCHFFLSFFLTKPVLSSADPEQALPSPAAAAAAAPLARLSPPSSSPGTFCFPLPLIWRISKGQDLIPFSGSFFFVFPF